MATITVHGTSGSIELPVREIPSELIDWFEEGRRAMYGRLKGGRDLVSFFPQHLPVLTTYTEGATFPFNCCNKGVGFVPKEKYLGELTAAFRTTLVETEGKPWKESLAQRIETASGFYFDREKIDCRVMSTLEIFEKTTFKNLEARPLASLLFTGHSPSYTSFQLNCAVEIVDGDDERYKFVQLARRLFEFDSFHIAQPQYRYAYLLWVVEVLDKTPKPVERRLEKSPTHTTSGELPWRPEALAALRRAPGFVQQLIRETVEAHATKTGATEVTLEIVQEATTARESDPRPI